MGLLNSMEVFDSIRSFCVSGWRLHARIPRVEGLDMRVEKVTRSSQKESNRDAAKLNTNLNPNLVGTMPEGYWDGDLVTIHVSYIYSAEDERATAHIVIHEPTKTLRFYGQPWFVGKEHRGVEYAVFSLLTLPQMVLATPWRIMRRRREERAGMTTHALGLYEQLAPQLMHEHPNVAELLGAACRNLM